MRTLELLLLQKGQRIQSLTLQAALNFSVQTENALNKPVNLYVSPVSWLRAELTEIQTT